MPFSRALLTSIAAVASFTLGGSQALAQDIQTPVSNNANATIGPDGSFVSSDGRFRLVFQQSDGDFVLYQGTTALWDSGVRYSNFGRPVTPSRTVFQGDGNLVVYYRDANGEFPAWSSRTWGRHASGFNVQNDGNVVIYSASGYVLWKTNTCCH